MKPTTETVRAIEAYEDMPKGIERLVDLLMTPLSSSFLVMVHRELGERLGIEKKQEAEQPVDTERAWQEIMNIGRGMR